MMLIVRKLGIQPYDLIWQQMKAFTIHRQADTPDELWLLEHSPVYTQGQAGKPCHILRRSDIPIIQTDRGGQVTYHGPGQLIAYLLMDLRRQNIGIRTLVKKLEQLVIEVLAHFDIPAHVCSGAPGVYVNDEAALFNSKNRIDSPVSIKPVSRNVFPDSDCQSCERPGVTSADHKIASIGLRVNQGCTYHGIALNVDMNLHPFDDINPCGFSALKMTQISHYTNNISLSMVTEQLSEAFIQYFGT